MEFINGFMRLIVHSADDTKSSQIAMQVYEETLAKHHSFLHRKVAAFAMMALPSRKALVETMCKQEPAEALDLADQVASALEAVYSIIEALYEEHGLLSIS